MAGGRAGAVSMTMEEAGAELVSGACLMLHASSSFETVLPPGTTVTDADGAHGVTVSASPTEAASTPDGGSGDGGQAPSEEAAGGARTGAPAGTATATPVRTDDVEIGRAHV